LSYPNITSRKRPYLSLTQNSVSDAPLPMYFAVAEPSGATIVYCLKGYVITLVDVEDYADDELTSELWAAAQVQTKASADASWSILILRALRPGSLAQPGLYLRLSILRVNLFQHSVCPAVGS
jgi:hypothetical protein